MAKKEYCEVGRNYVNLLWRAFVELNTRGVIVSLGARDDEFEDGDFIAYIAKGDKKIIFYRKFELDLDRLKYVLAHEADELRMWGFFPFKKMNHIEPIFY